MAIPVFYDGEIVFWVLNRAHQMDVGAYIPTSGSPQFKDTYEEGLQVPPLRDRPDDVPELVRFYAEMFPNQQDLPYRPFSVAAQNRLRNHPWPGNIRELRNLVQRLLVLGGEGEVSVAEVEEALQQNPPATGSAGASHPPFFDLPLREAREQFEREYLVYKLKEAGGSVGRLAESVGMERTHLYRKLRALGVDPKTAATSGGGQK